MSVAKRLHLDRKNKRKLVDKLMDKNIEKKVDKARKTNSVSFQKNRSLPSNGK